MLDEGVADRPQKGGKTWCSLGEGQRWKKSRMVKRKYEGAWESYVSSLAEGEGGRLKLRGSEREIPQPKKRP